MEGFSTGLTSALSTVGTLVNESLDIIVGNPWLMIIVGGSLLGVGFAVFKKARKAA